MSHTPNFLELFKYFWRSIEQNNTRLGWIYKSVFFYVTYFCPFLTELTQKNGSYHTIVLLMLNSAAYLQWLSHHTDRSHVLEHTKY